MNNPAANNSSAQAPPKKNPFCKKPGDSSSDNSHTDMFSNFFQRKGTSPNTQNNTFKPSNNVVRQADDQQENRPQNIPLIEAYANRNLTANIIQQKLSSRKTANQQNSIPQQLSKLQVQLVVSGNKCDVNQREMKKINDFSVQNGRNTQASLSLVQRKVQKIKAIQNCLSRLYLSIQSNNFNLLTKARKKPNPFKEHEIKRLLQGLVFYKPNPKFDFLSGALDKHILGPQVKQISKMYNLDMLKAYYAVKQVYIAQQILLPSCNNFQIKIQKNLMIESRRLVSLVGQFLHNDKKNLLMIYVSYLASDRKPSKNGVCHVIEEINLLWANIHMIKNQNIQLQEIVFEIYKKYSKYDHVQKYVSVELEAMRKCFEKINQKFSTKIAQMSIERMLQQGHFNISQCKGHYLDLVNVLVNRQTINFQSGIQRLNNVDLQQKWLEYFKNYVRQLSFDRNRREQQIMRACYLYKLSKLLYSKNAVLEKELEEKLVKLVCVNCSILLGLMFTELVHNKILRLFLLKLLLKYSQVEILRKEAEDGAIIRRLLPEQYKSTSIVDLIVDFIQKTCVDLINSGDLSILEVELSSGQKLMHLNFSGETPLQIIIYYISIFSKYASFQPKIQKNIENIFKLLKQKKAGSISQTLSYYNNKVINRIKEPSMIASHMVFLLDMTEQPLKKAQYIQKWLIYISNIEIQADFEQFYCVLVKLMEDIEISTQIEVSVRTIYIFLNCFSNQILKFINHYTTPQSLTIKLNLFTMLINVTQWYSLISQPVPESINFYKFQIKAQFQLTASRLIDKLTVPQQTMSQRLTIIHQLIITERQYDNTLNFTPSVLSDLVGKQKGISSLQLYGMVSQQLKKEKGIEPLVALYYITELESNLAKILINEIGLQFCAILKHQTHPSLITILKVIKLAINLFSYFSPSFKMQQKEKLRMLFRLIQDRLYLWLKNKKMSANFFRSLFDLMCASKNSMPYEYHITYLISAKRQNLFTAFTEQHFKKMGIHILYILSLKMSKKSCLVDITNEKQRDQLQEQLQVFTQIQLSVLRHFSIQQYSESFDQFSQRFITKLTKVLVQCANKAMINEVAIGLLRKINKALDQVIQKSNNNFFKKQKTLIQKFLQSYYSFQNQSQTLERPVQFLKCKNNKDFNQVLEKSLNKLALNPENELNDLEIGKMVSFIDKNPQYSIDFLALSDTFLQSKQSSLLFVQFVTKIMEKLDPDTYNKRQTKSMIRSIVTQLSSNITNFSDLYAIRLNRSFVSTINIILQNSLLSTFQVSAIFTPTITEILHLLRQILFKWTPCNIPSLHCLSQISLILSHYPSGTNYNKNFTLWNLVQYRQKLLLIDEILSYAREVSSLLDIKKYGLIQIIIQYTSFLVLNDLNLQTRETHQKIQGINKLLQAQPMNPNSLVNFISKDLSVSQLKKIAWNIVEHLNYLNFEYTNFEAQFFQNFNPNNNQ